MDSMYQRLAVSGGKFKREKEHMSLYFQGRRTTKTENMDKFTKPEPPTVTYCGRINAAESAPDLHDVGCSILKCSVYKSLLLVTYWFS